MANAAVIAAATLAFLGLVLAIVGTATPVWRHRSVSENGISKDESVGLFKFCYYTGCVALPEGFLDHPLIKDWWKTSQAFMILSILVNVACLIWICLYLGMPEKPLAVCGIVLAVVATICAVFGYSLWVIKSKKINDIYDDADLGYSFVLAVAASVLQLLAGIVLATTSCSSLE